MPIPKKDHITRRSNGQDSRFLGPSHLLDHFADMQDTDEIDFPEETEITSTNWEDGENLFRKIRKERHIYTDSYMGDRNNYGRRLYDASKLVDNDG